MTILVVHNRYREPGGEDRVVDLETALLSQYGHRVLSYIADNHAIDGLSRAALLGRTLWNHNVYREVRRLVERERVTLVHVHNTLPLISPAVYYAADAEGIPVIQTLHNYRLVCPNARCFRDGRACTDCVGLTVARPAVQHACYRGSRAATGMVAAMLLVHRAAGTWHSQVHTYIAPTAFARALFVAGGLPPEKIVVKPHFVDPDPGMGAGRGGYALYIGRLSADKGMQPLLDAWSRLAGRVPLVIVGDGPMAPAVAEAVRRLPGLQWLGQQQRPEVQRLLGDAAFVVVPSTGLETFGQVVIEAYAAGTPVIAADRNATAELIEHRVTGLLARRGDADDLVAQVEWLLAHPEVRPAMRTAARRAYESRFTAEANYRALAAIYGDATTRGARRSRRNPSPDWTIARREATL